MSLWQTMCLVCSLCFGLSGQTNSLYRTDSASMNPEIWITKYLQLEIRDAYGNQAHGTIVNCRDVYFGFIQPCRYASMGEARGDNWKYLPPFKTELPSYRLRKDLAKYRVLHSLQGTYPLTDIPQPEDDTYQSNDYMIDVPVFVVERGDRLLNSWESLAKIHSFFNCRGAMCDTIRETRVSRSSEGIEQSWVDRGDAKGSKDPDIASEESGTERALELCSVFRSAASDSLPFLCAKIATIGPQRRLMVPAFRLRDPYDLTIVAGGDEFIPTPLATVRGGSSNPRDAASRFLASAFLGPSLGFNARVVPGACLVAARIGQPSLVFKVPLSGASAFWETTWLRFDCEPSSEERGTGTVDIYVYLVLEHSYEKGMISPKPANDTERDQYFSYLKEHFAEGLRSHYKQRADEWNCNGFYFRLN